MLKSSSISVLSKPNPSRRSAAACSNSCLNMPALQRMACCLWRWCLLSLDGNVWSNASACLPACLTLRAARIGGARL
eukprot:scaffold233409_cov15-Tisochrysis_lutea.AAC.2